MGIYRAYEYIVMVAIKKPYAAFVRRQEDARSITSFLSINHEEIMVGIGVLCVALFTFMMLPFYMMWFS